MKAKTSTVSYIAKLFIITFSANNRMNIMTDEVRNTTHAAYPTTISELHQWDRSSNQDNIFKTETEYHNHSLACQRCRTSSSSWLAGPSDLRDSTIVLLGDNMGKALLRLSKCARRRRIRYSFPSAIPSLLQQVTHRHFNRHQLLLHVHKNTAMDSAAMVQLLKSAHLLYGGFSLIFAPGPADTSSQQQALLFAHGCRAAEYSTSCRWLTDPTPILKEAMRLNRKRQLLDLFAEGQCEEACKLSNFNEASIDLTPYSSFSLCGSKDGRCGQKQTSILVKHQNSTEHMINQLTNLWCEGTGHTIIDLRAKLQRKKTTEEYLSNSFKLSDLLPAEVRYYDKNRPPKYRGMPTEVYYHVTVISLDSIDEASMTFVTDIFLAQSWRDNRLRMPVNMTENYRILDVSYLQHIWRPDLFFKNAKQVTFHEMTVPNHYLWFYKDKTLLYMTKLTLVLSCAMKFQSFPHDTQSCSMMMESLSHTTNDVVFLWNHTDPLMVNPDIELPQLDIAKNTTEDCTLTYSTGNFTCLAVRFHLKRRLGYHLFHSYIPSALIVVMSWISFWIKPEAIPARVTLGVTSLLILATQNQQTQQSLPPVSYVKAVDVWMSSCSVFIFSTLMEYAVVNHFMGPLSHRAVTTDSQDDLTYLTDRRSKKVGFFSRLVQYKGGQKVITSRQPQYTTIRYGREVALRIDHGSRICFPLCFFLFNVGYWTKYVDI